EIQIEGELLVGLVGQDGQGVVGLGVPGVLDGGFIELGARLGREGGLVPAGAPGQQGQGERQGEYTGQIHVGSSFVLRAWTAAGGISRRRAPSEPSTRTVSPAWTAPLSSFSAATSSTWARMVRRRGRAP